MSGPGPYDAVLGGDKYRQTAKWVSAKQIAATHNITGADQDDIYSQLNSAGYLWDAESKAWELLAEEADPPTELINIRVWSDAKQVEAIAKQLTTALQTQGLKLIEQSKPYPCRPPKQLEARVYLKFQSKN